jgi:predicted ATPase
VTVAIRDCLLVAVEGTHASGKTTLIHALVAHYRALGVLVDCTGEPARTSPFIEEIVIHGRGSFDLATEVDLFAAQLMAQLRAARHQRLLICDKTVANVLAYARLVLDPSADPQTATVLDAMERFCRAWAPAYDLVLYSADQYRHPADPYRAKVATLQGATAHAVRTACTETGIELHNIPLGLTVAERVAWVARRVDPLLEGRLG